MSCKVIRIGVFFDGTGNNLFNDEVGRSQNGVSNIGKLYRLYPNYPQEVYLIGDQITECRIHTKSIYLEGLGTDQGKSDNVKGGAFGAGGALRIQSAINQVEEIRKKFPANDYKCYIDVFGFSRGAALARDFINTIYKNYSILDCIFKFVGLFDTVGSFGLPGNDKNWKPKTDKHNESSVFFHELFDITPSKDNFESYNFNLSPSSAEKIVHFVALDEYRENFPLSDTQGAGETYEFIGAHSDVGGGYRQLERENIFEYSDKSIKKTEEIGEGWHCRNLSERELSETGLKFLCKGYRNITDDLQRVAFAAMYNLAVKEKVPFLPFTENSAESEVQMLAKEIAYSKPSYAFTELMDEAWSEELKQYSHIAEHEIETLTSFLSHHTDYFYQTDKKSSKQVNHYRSPLHLKLLAQYAHNSSTTNISQGTYPAPLGFKHREGGFTDAFANLAFYTTMKFKYNLPVRKIFQNDPMKAVKNTTGEEFISSF